MKKFKLSIDFNANYRFILLRSLKLSEIIFIWFFHFTPKQWGKFWSKILLLLLHFEKLNLNEMLSKLNGLWYDVICVIWCVMFDMVWNSDLSTWKKKEKKSWFQTKVRFFPLFFILHKSEENKTGTLLHFWRSSYHKPELGRWDNSFQIELVLVS